MTLLKSLPVVNRRLIGGKKCWKFGVLARFSYVIFCILPRLWKMRHPKAGIE
jgi:hypothetical protein